MDCESVALKPNLTYYVKYFYFLQRSMEFNIKH